MFRGPGRERNLGINSLVLIADEISGARVNVSAQHGAKNTEEAAPSSEPFSAVTSFY